MAESLFAARSVEQDVSVDRMFEPGETIELTQTINGKLWWAEPMRVVADSADASVLYIAPGTVYRMPDRLVPLSRADRGAIIWDLRRSGDWELTEQTWQSNHKLTFLYPEKYYSIFIFWSLRPHPRPDGRPLRRSWWRASTSTR